MQETIAGRQQTAGQFGAEIYSPTSLSGLGREELSRNYKVTDEELAGYGLDHPQAVLSYTYEKDGEDKTFSLSVGNPGEDGTTYYTRTEDSKYVNEIDKTALDQCITADTGNGRGSKAPPY